MQNNNHFDLDNDHSYQLWRDKKLSDYPMSLDDLVVEVNDIANLSGTEKQQLELLISKTNMVLYATKASHVADDFETNKEQVRKLGEQFSLTNLDHNECADNDAITALQINREGLHKYYIPYSNKPINWHTDGYYNKLDKQIFSLILHCVCPATKGGENELLDPEMVYIQLRDINPQYIKALMASDAMLIPKNVIDGELIRPDRNGPVFMLDGSDQLHMRYSARKRNIIWKDDSLIKEAESALRSIMQENGKYQFKGKLQAGQGLLCRNVLHTRGGFDEVDQSDRLMFRARYFDKLKI